MRFVRRSCTRAEPEASASTEMDRRRFSKTPAAAVARRLVLEAATAEVAGALAADGIRSVLLKGPAVARWLYAEDPTRSSVDVDLLVAREKSSAAGSTLKRLGFRRAHASGHAEVWGRQRDGVVVDLHSSLVGIPPGAPAWEVLSASTEEMQIGGRGIVVLSPPARAFHVVLHAAQHGVNDERSVTDLDRALARVGADEWQEAAALARKLDAEDAFAAGLRLLPHGQEEAAQLGLSERRSLETAVRAEGAPAGVLGIYRFVKTPGIRPRLRLLADEVFPSPGFLRAVSPLARKGRVGLLAAYAWRPFWLLSRLGPAYRAWRRARTVR
jgi:Uncharacterised nucleotidyltransferase